MSSSSNASIAKKARTKAEADFATCDLRASMRALLLRNELLAISEIFCLLQAELGEAHGSWLVGFGVNEITPSCGMPEHEIVAFALRAFEKGRAIWGDYGEGVSHRVIWRLLWYMT